MFLPSPAILLVVSFGVLVDAGVKTFCIASSAKEGEEAQISCHFDTDINTVQKNVLLYFFKDNIQQPVFIIAWHDGKPDMSTEPGYEWDGKISDHIIIKIPKVHLDQAGEYKCIVAPDAEGDARGCTLNTSGIKNDSLLTTFQIFPTTKLAEDTTEPNEDLFIAVIFVAGLGVMIIIVLAVVAVRKRFPCMREEQQENCTTTNLADIHLLASSKKINRNI